ncbi:MAG: DJ-1/PfpI family protein [Actinomycetota bacterium]|nr:DJ-1/PfpI family protein [Actinomycetota bacterium]
MEPDVLLVAGGLAVGAAADDPRLAGLAARSREVGSVCTGALLLAEAGMLDGRRVTTHWALADLLTSAHPEVEVDADRIYLHDGVWSSAGVTAGIDLALQLLRSHHGSEIAAQATRHLVVDLQRAGGQQQYSTHLADQRSSHPTIADLLAHVADHPDANLSIHALAGHVAMSERGFQRLCSPVRSASAPAGRRARPHRRRPTAAGTDRRRHRPPLWLPHHRDLPPGVPAPRRRYPHRLPPPLSLAPSQ